MSRQTSELPDPSDRPVKDRRAHRPEKPFSLWWRRMPGESAYWRWAQSWHRKGRYRTREAIRFRSKLEDFPSREAQRKATELSCHIIMQMRDIAANTFAMGDHLGKLFEQKFGMTHVGGVDFDPELDQ